MATRPEPSATPPTPARRRERFDEWLVYLFAPILLLGYYTAVVALKIAERGHRDPSVTTAAEPRGTA